MTCLRANYKKKKTFLASLKSMKKGVGFGSGSAPKCHGSPTLIITNLKYLSSKGTSTCHSSNDVKLCG